MQQVIALASSDETFYLVPSQPFPTHSYRAGLRWTAADGSPLTMVRANRYGGGGWYKAAGAPQDIVARRPVDATVTGYRLKDPETESVKFPPALTVEQYRANTAPYDDDEAWPGHDLYERITEPNPDETVTFPVADMLVIADAQPAPDDGLAWVVNIHDELKQHTELFHLFPGHLPGFRAAFIDAVKALPFMRNGLFADGAREDRERPGVVVAHRQVAYTPRTTRRVLDETAKRRRRPTTTEVVETKDLRVSLPVRDRIEGTTRAEAVAAWRAEMTRLLDTVTEALTEAPCWHCRGTGVVSHADLATTPANH